MFDREQVFKGPEGRNIFRSPEAAPASVKMSGSMTRYRVSGVNDPSEVSAEQKADEVMGGSVFRAPEGVGDAGGEVSIPSADLAGMGSALPENLQRSMEDSFGSSFAGVRVHTDAGADRASRGLSARAFTRGQDMYFRSGAYDPDSFEGQHLIAHELAHVAAGEEGLHRVFEKPPMDSAAPGSSLSEEERKKYYESRQEQIVAGVEKIKGAASTLIADSAKLSMRYGPGAQSEDFSKEELEASKEKLKDRDSIASAAAEYAAYLDEYAQNYAGYQFEPESLQDNASAKKQEDLMTRLNNDSFYTMLKQKKAEVEAVRKQCDDNKSGIDATLVSVNALLQEQASQSGGGNTQEPVSGDVKKMVQSPWFDKFVECINELRGTRLALGAGNVAAMEDALKSAANRSAMQPVQGEGLRTAQRVTGAAGALVDTVSIGTDLLGNSSDLMVARDGEDSHQGLQNDADIADKTMSIASTVTTAADFSLSAAQLHNKEAARAEKAKALGVNVSSADTLSRLDVAGKGLSTASGAFGITSSFLGSESGTVKESSTDITGNILGMTGDILGLASTDQKRRQQIRQAEAARRGMLPLAKQLRGSISDNNANASLSQGGTNNNRSQKIHEVASKAENMASKKDKNRSQAGGANNESLLTAANIAIDNNNSLEPKATTKQKALLGSVIALATSIKNSEGNAKDLKADTALASIGMIGDIAGLVASSINAAGLGKAGGMAGAILGMIGTVLGAVAGSKGIVEGVKGVADRSAGKDAANEKANIAQSAIQQMAMLPYLNTAALKASVEANADGKVAKSVNDAAERYAAVFSIIEAGNVEFADILFAIKQGEFGGEGSLDEKMKKMYGNLAFSNLDM